VSKRKFALLLMLPVIASGAAFADDLTKIVQQDLVTLGYDPGNTEGEATTQTIVAISKFQAENELEVTGEASPQLAGVIKAAIKRQETPVVGANAAAASPPVQDAAALQAAQQACLQEKIARAQEANKKKRGLGSLVRAVARTSSRFGSNEAARDVYEASRNVYDANATAADLSSAAKDLGLTEDEVEQCRNPS
jgi:peptidoglycan hydrolase-like protein with peptidoglycan-binding domain